MYLWYKVDIHVQCMYVCVCVCMCVCLSLAGMNLKILVVDIHQRDLHPPVQMRAEQGWTVTQLKEEIGMVKHGNCVHTCSLHPYLYMYGVALCKMLHVPV